MKLNTLPPVAIMLALSVGGIAVAEPVNVEISGNTRIRGNYFDMDSIGDTRFIQQNTRVSIKVDFTSDVSAVVDLDHTDGARYERRPASRPRRISRNR
ncbi:MAG: hypothetical protein BWX80_01762 [Candidatus Hydrogenedentes bacterium ADurb.Bin101]|nr:MAG: hypothetical protein BWX80_01762 [Candidatus Hydrogenedentes bacterium ADurb.Bin101]